MLGKQRPKDSWEEFRASWGKLLRLGLKIKLIVVAGGWGNSVIESFLTRYEALGSILRGKKTYMYGIETFAWQDFTQLKVRMCLCACVCNSLWRAGVHVMCLL